MRMAEASLLVTRAAETFGLDPARLGRLGGNSGSSWDAGEHVLRAGNRGVMDRELAAVAAVSAVLPVPRVIARADFAEGSAVLLEKLPGRPAADVAQARPALARAAGLACGTVHARLAEVPAPAGLRAAPHAPSGCGRRAGARLLHLDLHPFNVLVGEDGTVTGVLDWATAAAGDPVLDRARTWTILTLDPAARARGAQPAWQALSEGWAQSAGLHDIPATARAWACRFMLADLARRYSPDDLKHISHALGEAETAARPRKD
jgi:aminoglycoside phosphotransferase (APT) family kinase protein